MDICLIRPASVTNLNSMGDDAVLPIGLAYLAAVLQEESHLVTIIDSPGEGLGKYESIKGTHNGLRHGLSDKEIISLIPPKTKIVGISIMFSMEWLL